MNDFMRLVHLGTNNVFALLLDMNGKIEVAGVSRLGKDWERWFREQPAGMFQSLDDVLMVVGDDVAVAESRKATRADRSAFAAANVA